MLSNLSEIYKTVDEISQQIVNNMCGLRERNTIEQVYIKNIGNSLQNIRPLIIETKLTNITFYI